MISLMFSGLINASTPDREPTAPTILSDQRRFSPDDNFRAAAMNSFSSKIDRTIEPYIRSHFEEIVQERIASPSPDLVPAHPRIIVRYDSIPNVISDDEMHEGHISEYELNDMVARAIARGFDHRDRRIQEQNARIEKMFTTKKVVAIAALAGSIAAIASSIVSIASMKS